MSPRRDGDGAMRPLPGKEMSGRWQGRGKELLLRKTGPRAEAGERGEDGGAQLGLGGLRGRPDPGEPNNRAEKL